MKKMMAVYDADTRYADVYIIMKKCFRFVFRLLKKCESWKRKVLMQFLSVIDKKKGKKEAKMNFTI